MLWSAEASLDHFSHLSGSAPGVTVMRLAAPQLYHAAWEGASRSGMALRRIWEGADASVMLLHESCRVQARHIAPSSLP